MSFLLAENLHVMSKRENNVKYLLAIANIYIIILKTKCLKFQDHKDTTVADPGGGDPGRHAAPQVSRIIGPPRKIPGFATVPSNIPFNYVHVLPISK